MERADHFVRSCKIGSLDTRDYVPKLISASNQAAAETRGQSWHPNLVSEDFSPLRARLIVCDDKSRVSRTIYWGFETGNGARERLGDDRRTRRA